MTLQYHPEMTLTLVLVALAFLVFVSLLVLTVIGAVFHVGPCQTRWKHRMPTSDAGVYVNQPNFRPTQPLPGVTSTVVTSKRVDKEGTVVLNGN